MLQSAYPDQARYVSRACTSLDLQFTDLDNGGGYLFSVSDGSDEFVSGTGRICTYPLNTAPAYCIALDKSHTSSVLSRCAIDVIPGKLFFISDYHAKLRERGRDLSDAVAFVDSSARPLFCKPNSGSRGDFAEVIYDIDAFNAYIDRVRMRHDAILVQEIIDGDEYRIFCMDEKAVFGFRKSDFTLRGDGVQSVSQLLREINTLLTGHGISLLDEDSTSKLIQSTRGLHTNDIVPIDEHISIPGRRNISAGSDIGDFASSVPEQLSTLALRAAKAIGIRVSGVDIFDTSPFRDLSQLKVIEVNGNPSISSLESLGHTNIIDEIWNYNIRTFFNERALLRTHK